MSKVIAIIQARMGASRLPGKPLKQVLGKYLIEYLVDRLRLSKTLNGICVATTDNPKDQAIVDWCHRHYVSVVRGSEPDVLSRYLQAAYQSHADIIVRITADCPLMDPLIVDKVVNEFLQGDYDYVSNTLERSYPRGMDVEVFSLQALERAAKEAVQPAEREHVTLYIYQHPEFFKIKNVSADVDGSMHRWTVDTSEDFTLIKTLLEAITPLKPQFSCDDLLALSNEHPEWQKINAHVSQKPAIPPG